MSKFKIATVFMIFALLFNSCNSKVDDIELNDGSSLKGHWTNQPVKLPKQDYYNYRDSLFTSTQDFYNFADSMDWPCFFTYSTPAQRKIMYETYLWVKYSSDPDLFLSLWEMAEEMFDATLNGTLYQNTNPVFVETMDEIYYEMDLIRPGSDFSAELDEYLEDKFDEVYEEDISIQVQDEILSAICLIQVQSMLMQANAECYNMMDWPDWNWKCILSTVGGTLGGAVAGLGGGAAGATALVSAGVMASTGVGTLVIGAAVLGGVGAGMWSASQNCFDDDGTLNPNYFEMTIPEQPILRMKMQKLRI